MLKYAYFLVPFLFLVKSCGGEKKMAETESEQVKPNIIYILADDLGYGELGAYGQEKIETPNIDALAQNGMLFTQHYTAPRSVPRQDICC
jgi:arylsulfatase